VASGFLFSRESAWRAAHIDEGFEIERCGVDAVATPWGESARISQNDDRSPLVQFVAKKHISQAFCAHGPNLGFFRVVRVSASGRIR
jgi:hypothetical protein